jgi:alkanesulfonate monooxygenase SsuD/methylene tetrahydromethanopterin reductase-like flavin-dependent oxidoreductase (luciferase family)
MMAVALERTRRIRVGPWVTVPTGARYHPAIIAQAAATLDNMYPGRFMLGVGSGEALNERPFWNGKWPKWEERMGRLAEGIRLMRQLWEFPEPFKFDGKYFSSDLYFLYTKPSRRIPIYCSAIGKRAAYGAGVHSDGLITISPRNDVQKLKEVILPAYIQGRRESNKDGLGKVALELVFSFSEPEELIKSAWRTLGINRKDSWSIPTPVAVEEARHDSTADTPVHLETIPTAGRVGLCARRQGEDARVIRIVLDFPGVLLALHAWIAQPFREGPDVIGQVGCHRRSAGNQRSDRRGLSQRSHRPTEII